MIFNFLKKILKRMRTNWIWINKREYIIEKQSQLQVSHYCLNVHPIKIGLGQKSIFGFNIWEGGRGKNPLDKITRQLIFYDIIPIELTMHQLVLYDIIPIELTVHQLILYDIISIELTVHQLVFIYKRMLSVIYLDSNSNWPIFPDV